MRHTSENAVGSKIPCGGRMDRITLSIGLGRGKGIG